MRRTPESLELMDEASQASAYAEADFSAANSLFLALFTERVADDFAGSIVDMGCGPADIPIRLARRFPHAHIDAVDGAPAMLELANQAIDAARLGRQIDLHCHHLPTDDLPGDTYDAIVSNSLLHHLNDPATLWQSINTYARPGTVILIMDLLRPAAPQQVDHLVAEYAQDAPEVLRRDFKASLYAAYTLEEVQQQLEAAGLQALQVNQVSDRHLAVAGTAP